MRGIVHRIKADDENPQVLLKSGGINIILTTKRIPFHRRQQFLDLDLIPENHAIVTVKIGILVPKLEAIARNASLVLSAGAANQTLLRSNSTISLDLVIHSILKWNRRQLSASSESSNRHWQVLSSCERLQAPRSITYGKLGQTSAILGAQSTAFRIFYVFSGSMQCTSQ